MKRIRISIAPADVSPQQKKNSLNVQVDAVGIGLANAAASFIFQAGIDLVFFDELMKTIPIQYSATFVSIAQSAQNLAGVIAPMAGSSLATRVGVRMALGASSLVRFAGFISFARRKKA